MHIAGQARTFLQLQKNLASQLTPFSGSSMWNRTGMMCDRVSVQAACHLTSAVIEALAVQNRMTAEKKMAAGSES